MLELEKFLNDFMNKECACKKSHQIKLPQIIVENGAILSLSKIISQKGLKKAYVLADINTFSVAGESVLNELDKASVSYTKHVFKNENLEPDEYAVGSAIMHFDKGCDFVVSIGSGVLNDIGKILSAMANIPYIIVATAPSMDGYASATSSMSRDGLKVSLPSKCADVIIGDIDILKTAPIKMLQAGLGDMLAKYVSIAEWRIAYEVVGEYYCERVAELIRGALKKCVDNAKGLLNREDEAIKAVFEGLVIGGVAMAFAGVSRPASGVEHYLSHVWDMRGLEFKTKVDLHGIQCAIGTLIASKLYEYVISISPDKQKALESVKEFNYLNWSNQLKQFLGKSADAMIALEKKEQKYDVNKHENRLNVILAKWDKIVEIIKEEIPTSKEIEFILDLIGAPKSIGEIGIDCDLFMAFASSKDIRDKYVLSSLCWDLGILNEVKL